MFIRGSAGVRYLTKPFKGSIIKLTQSTGHMIKKWKKRSELLLD